VLSCECRAAEEGLDPTAVPFVGIVR